MKLFNNMKWSRWVQNQFKDQENVEEMQRRLRTKANNSNYWLTELVNEMLVSPDTPSTPEFNNERVSKALNEVEFLHPEIFEDLQSFVEPNTKANKLNDSPDSPPTLNSIIIGFQRRRINSTLSPRTYVKIDKTLWNLVQAYMCYIISLCSSIHSITFQA